MNENYGNNCRKIIWKLVLNMYCFTALMFYVLYLWNNLNACILDFLNEKHT